MDVLIATIGVFFGELYGNFVGGGSLLTQFVLQSILQIPLKEAVALDNVATLGSNIGLLVVLLRKFKLSIQHLYFAIFVALGSFAGAKFLVFINADILKIVFILSILFLLFKNFGWDLFLKDKFASSKAREPQNNLSGIALPTIFISAFLVGFYNSAFVIGDWIFSLLLLTQVLNLKYTYSIFLLVSSLFSGQILAAYVYFDNNLIDLRFAIPMILATTIGGVISAKLLDKLNEKHLIAFLKFLSIVFAVMLTIDLMY